MPLNSMLSTLIRSSRVRLAKDTTPSASLTTSLISAVGGPMLIIGAILYFIGYVSWGTYLDAMSLTNVMSGVSLNEVLMRGAWSLATPAFFSVIFCLFLTWFFGMEMLSYVQRLVWGKPGQIAAFPVILALALISIWLIYAMSVRAGNIRADFSKRGDGLPPVITFYLTESALKDLAGKPFMKSPMEAHSVFLLHQDEHTVFLLLPGKQQSDSISESHHEPPSDAIIFQFPRSSIAALITH